jgi:hypothetical protein
MRGNIYLFQRDRNLLRTFHVLEPDLIIKERLEQGTRGTPSTVHVPLHVSNLLSKEELNIEVCKAYCHSTERRNTQDMVQTFKLVRGMEKIERIELFRHVSGGRTRQDADPLNLRQTRSRLEIRKNFYTQRVVKNWNSLPQEAKNANTTASFKNALKSFRSGEGERQQDTSQSRYA